MADNKIKNLLNEFKWGNQEFRELKEALHDEATTEVMESLKQIIESCLPEKYDLDYVAEKHGIHSNTYKWYAGHNDAVDEMRDAINREFSDE